ncbi:hypothetical protein FDP41_012693 [Naegleria fowleri]|uniref:Uncharacterized protein n=1 Tax=Naegleria fowleri TaxID=5763 RepID=A0A6A5C611_NAEFO|nr:uncharacterized protein FDP41_012693 [Naegleria fowleri]KAF0980905.1 hypothetical protein FDP41_012693 [Naegleria fowleri]CAG4716606.1 unnamed protein product [Naegleria fowleri]
METLELQAVMSVRDVWIHILEMLEVKDLLLSIALLNRDHYKLIHGSYLMNFILRRDFKELILKDDDDFYKNHLENNEVKEKNSLNYNNTNHHLMNKAFRKDHQNSFSFYGINENGHYRLAVPNWSEYSIIPIHDFKAFYLLFKSELQRRNTCCRGFIFDRIFSTMSSSKMKRRITECRHDEVRSVLPMKTQTNVSCISNDSNSLHEGGESKQSSWRTIHNYQFKCNQCGLTLVTEGFHPCEITKSTSSGNVYYWLQPGHKYRIENIKEDESEALTSY